MRSTVEVFRPCYFSDHGRDLRQGSLIIKPHPMGPEQLPPNATWKDENILLKLTKKKEGKNLQTKKVTMTEWGLVGKMQSSNWRWINACALVSFLGVFCDSYIFKIYARFQFIPNFSRYTCRIFAMLTIKNEWSQYLFGNSAKSMNV